MSVTPTELARTIRIARKQRGLTLKELADEAGIGKTAMFDLEHGNPGVRLNTLLAVLDRLGLSLRLDGNQATAAAAAPPPPPKSADAEPVESLPDHLL